MLTRHGFDVVGLEVVEKDVEVARKYTEGKLAKMRAQPELDADVNAIAERQDRAG